MKKCILYACLVSMVLSGCGSKNVQDDMTKEEAIRYGQQLFADNAGRKIYDR